LEGVIEFRIRAYDTNGVWMTGSSVISNNFYFIHDSPPTVAPGEVDTYGFQTTSSPAFVELQLGVLEPQILKRYNSIPDPTARSNFLASHAGNVQLFRQRVAVRNVDPLAYQP
jgi:hypothetical protein